MRKDEEAPFAFLATYKSRLSADGKAQRQCDAADAGRIATQHSCRVMRVNFGDRMAEMHHEHSDTLVVTFFKKSAREFPITVDPLNTLAEQSEP